MICVGLCALFLVLAGITKSFLDFSSENGFNSQYWDKGKGWMLKWKIENKKKVENFHSHQLY